MKIAPHLPPLTAHLSLPHLSSHSRSSLPSLPAPLSSQPPPPESSLSSQPSPPESLVLFPRRPVHGPHHPTQPPRRRPAIAAMRRRSAAFAGVAPFVRCCWSSAAIPFALLAPPVSLPPPRTKTAKPNRSNRTNRADYDLTGQLVWPGAVLLNNYLSNNTAILQGSSIIELGSGVAVQMFKSFLVVEGVTGILCSRFCHEILLTDHNEQILKKNIELQPSHENHTNYAAEKLEWGNVSNGSYLEKHVSQTSALSLNSHDDYSRRSRTSFLMDVMVLNEAVKHGLQVREVEGTRSVVSNLEGKVKDPIVVLPIHDKLDLENLLGNAFQELTVLVPAYVRTLFGTEGQITSAEENIDHGQDMRIEDERFF
ncbi:hypothetical protein Syun_031006 [Stephania yunnanensis]|uniref:Uncharacterized protein n=1 Tax=Stephania yunnanensis TaxID=152371 RepID=A0AAP0DVT2_9MAGN